LGYPGTNVTITHMKESREELSPMTICGRLTSNKEVGHEQLDRMGA